VIWILICAEKPAMASKSNLLDSFTAPRNAQIRGERIAFSAEEQNDGLVAVQNRTLMSLRNEFEANCAALGIQPLTSFLPCSISGIPTPRNLWITGGYVCI
jgi:hypothetical protein